MSTFNFPQGKVKVNSKRHGPVTFQCLYRLNLYWLIVSLSWPTLRDYAWSFDPIQARFASNFIALSFQLSALRLEPSASHFPPGRRRRPLWLPVRRGRRPNSTPFIFNSAFRIPTSAFNTLCPPLHSAFRIPLPHSIPSVLHYIPHSARNIAFS